MGRFDRDDTGNQATNGDTGGREEPALPPVPWTVGSTTEKVRSMLQRHVREIIDDAGARAAAIERRALEKANEMEQESQRRANETRESQEAIRQTLGSALQRAEAILHGTEALNAELGKVIDSFKAEIENLTAELHGARDMLAPAMPDQVEPPVTAPESPPEPPPPPVEEQFVALEEPEVALEEEPVVALEEEPVVALEEEPVVALEEEPEVALEEAALEAEPVAAPESATGDERAHEAIRQQLIRLREAGSPREEAERYLVRYKQRGDHQEILDEVFGPEEPAKRRRRRLLRRD